MLLINLEIFALAFYLSRNIGIFKLGLSQRIVIDLDPSAQPKLRRMFRVHVEDGIRHKILALDAICMWHHNRFKR